MKMPGPSPSIPQIVTELINELRLTTNDYQEGFITFDEWINLCLDSVWRRNSTLIRERDHATRLFMWQAWKDFIQEAIEEAGPERPLEQMIYYYRETGDALKHLDRKEEAVTALTKAIELIQKHRIASGWWQQILRRTFAKRAALLFSLGHTAESLSDLEEAQQHFDRNYSPFEFIDLIEDSAACHLKLGNIKESKRQIEEAQYLLNYTLRHGPERLKHLDTMLIAVTAEYEKMYRPGINESALTAWHGAMMSPLRRYKEQYKTGMLSREELMTIAKERFQWLINSADEQLDETQQRRARKLWEEWQQRLDDAEEEEK